MDCATEHHAGEAAEAVARMERTSEAHVGDLMFITLFPELDGLRDNLRFPDPVRRVKR